MNRPLAHRWWYSPPWRITRPWQPRVFRATDEYCNPTVWLQLIPFTGGLTIRYGRHIRDHACYNCIQEFGPWCAGCLSCHQGPRCHPWADNCQCDWDVTSNDANLTDCPACGGSYCPTCDTDPASHCPETP